MTANDFQLEWERTQRQRLELAATESSALVREARILDAYLHDIERANPSFEPHDRALLDRQSKAEVVNRLRSMLVSPEEWLTARLSELERSSESPVDDPVRSAADAISGQISRQSDRTEGGSQSRAGIRGPESSAVATARSLGRFISAAAAHALRQAGAIFGETGQPLLAASSESDEREDVSLMRIEGPLGIKGIRRPDGTYRFSCPEDRQSDVVGQYLLLTIGNESIIAGPFNDQGSLTWAPDPSMQLDFKLIRLAKAGLVFASDVREAGAAPD